MPIYMQSDLHPPPVALELMAEGRFADAVAPLKHAVLLGAVAATTILNLAIAIDRTGDHCRGQRMMQQVAAQNPGWAEPWLRLAESLRTQGEFRKAEKTYRKVLELDPERHEAALARAGLLLMFGQPNDARLLLLRCCAHMPSNAAAWNALGLSFGAMEAYGVALVAFSQAQIMSPHHLEYVLNGVGVTIEAGEPEAEVLRFATSCAVHPLNPVSQAGRGVLAERLGMRAEAIGALEIACALAPDEPALLRLLGGSLARSSHVQRAEEVLRQVWVLEPDDSQAANNLAAVLMRLHRHAEARDILLDILERRDGDTGLLCNLANATACIGLQDEAVAIARRAELLAPGTQLPLRALCNTLPYRDGTSAPTLLASMRECSAALPRVPQPTLINDRDPDRTLVIGLLSGTLRCHPVGWLTVAGIEMLDPDQFHVVCLVQNAASEDPIARRYKRTARDWIEVDGLSDTALTDLARDQKIDILIDLGGYGDAGRMAACANRLAPVQIKWVGMQAHSSGLAEMDWFMTDRWETPEGFDQFYSEKLLRLPDGYVCYSPPPLAPDVLALPALRNGFVTFGCFNNLAKVTPRVIQVWGEILRRVPDSKMILKTHQLSHQETAANFLRRFSELGIDGGRVALRGSSGHRAFMGEYGDVDIVLDPFPYSGGLTTCEALWMGVPTITMPGEIFASRHSASHMSNAGLPDWVVTSVDDYIAMAVSKANDLNGLAGLRAGLREQVRQSPLCDASRFGRNLGAALRSAWKDWCQSCKTLDD